MPNDLVAQLAAKLSGVNFIDGTSFYWSPKKQAIYMNSEALETEEGAWALLHEAGHARLKHQSYANDIGLLELEVEAWAAAQKLAKGLHMSIDPEHIEDCLNTYRDWLYARSTCPTCELNSLQVEETTYICLNCSTRWNVSASRFCRPYRMKAVANI